MPTLLDWNGENQTADDMSRKFTGTFIQVKVIGGQPAVIKLEQFDASKVFYFSGPQCGGLGAKRADIEVVCPLPEPGVYKYMESRVAVLRRLPARQWHEGLYKGNTHLRLDGELDWQGAIDWEMAFALFAPQVDKKLDDVLPVIQPEQSVRLTHTHWVRCEKDGRVNLFNMSRRLGSWFEGTFFYAKAHKHSSRICRDDMIEELHASL